MEGERLLRISSGQREPLRKALMSAYRSKEKLEMLLLEGMEVRLDNEVGGETYTKKVANLIDWAEEYGRLAELLNVAYRRNPGNPDLKQFLASFNIVPTSALPQTVPTLGMESVTDFAWRGPEQDLELQSFWRPEPELWDVAFLNQGIRQTAAVCLFELAGKGIGTGFLIQKDLVLTNYHILAPELEDDPTAFLDDIVLHFTHLPGEQNSLEAQTFRLASDAIVKLSHTRQLDYALLRVENKILEHKKIHPVDFEQKKIPAKNSSIYLLQHPGGQSMKLALSSNGVTGVYQSEGLLQYVSRAARGSSGAPCFNDNWQVVALHHAGKVGGSERKCEGILLSTIYPEIAEFFL